MGKGFSGAVLRALGAKEHLLTVTGKTPLADHFLRIHFHTDTLLSPEGEAPGRYLRLWPHRHGTDGFFAAVWQRR